MKVLSPILVIGGGTMGEIIIQGLLKQHAPTDIIIADPSLERANYLRETYSVQCSALTVELTKPANTLILAVKPQDCQTVAETITEGLHGQLIISIMAGVSSERLGTLFTSNRVIRTMPNTPAQIGMGMTVWTASSNTTDTDKEFVRSLFSSFGEEVYVDKDDDIDKATAVSASGPAYVFFFAEQFIQAAKELGLEPDMASQLVKQTLRGASELMYTSSDNPDILRAKVTSKKGTTEAAISSLPADTLQLAWTNAIRAAYTRAKELSNDSTTV